MSTRRLGRPRAGSRKLALGALAATTALGGSIVAAGPAAAKGHPASVRVTSAADSGEGSLRSALEAASANPRITTITVQRGLGTIAVTSPLHFAGPQPLRLDGGGATVDGSALAAQEDVVTLAGPDVTVRDLTVSGGHDDGLVVPVARMVTLHGFTAADNGANGVLVEDGGGNHGLRLDVRQTTFARNGLSVCDTDGMRVNETGDGTLDATLVGVTAHHNEHDGVELDERGAGDAIAKVRGSAFTDNGVNDCTPFDLEDGFDVDELDDGDVVVDIADTTATGNAEEGLDLDEGDDELGPEQQRGDLVVTLRNVDASNNGAGAEEDDIDIDEVGDGDYTVRMTNVTSNGAFNDGYDGSEDGAGDMRVVLVNSSFSSSADGRGIDIEETGDGSAGIWTLNVQVDGNDSDGLRGRESGAGSLLVGALGSSFTGNGGDSLDLSIEDPGEGTLLLRATAYDVLKLSPGIVVDEA